MKSSHSDVRLLGPLGEVDEAGRRRELGQRGAVLVRDVRRLAALQGDGQLLQRLVVVDEERLDLDVGVGLGSTPRRGVERVLLARRRVAVPERAPSPASTSDRRRPVCVRCLRSPPEQAARDESRATEHQDEGHFIAAWAPCPVTRARRNGSGGGDGRGRGPARRECDRHAVDQDQLSHRVELAGDDRGAGRRTSSSATAGSGPRIQTAGRGPGEADRAVPVLHGGIGLREAPLVSRIFNAASLARPTVHPCPRNTKWSNAVGVDGNRLESARSASAKASVQVLPEVGPQERQRRGGESCLDHRPLVGERRGRRRRRRPGRPASRRPP